MRWVEIPGAFCVGAGRRSAPDQRQEHLVGLINQIDNLDASVEDERLALDLYLARRLYQKLALSVEVQRIGAAIRLRAAVDGGGNPILWPGVGGVIARPT